MVVRAGWVVKSFHSFFYYWNGMKSSMVKTGKALAGWCAGNSETGYTMGLPPSLANITTETEKVEGFVSSLVGHKASVSREVQYMLIGNAVRFYDDVIVFLQKHPNEIYKGNEVMKHPFVFKFETALMENNVAKYTFSSWKEEVTTPFYFANCLAHHKFIGKIGNKSVSSLPCKVTVAEFFTNTQQMQASMMSEIEELKRESKHLKATIKAPNSNINAKLNLILSHIGIHNNEQIAMNTSDATSGTTHDNENTNETAVCPHSYPTIETIVSPKNIKPL